MRIHGSVLVVAVGVSINLASLTIDQVLSKRRKVVRDMVNNVLGDFQRSLSAEVWKALGDSAQQRAYEYLQLRMKELTDEEAEYYNDDTHLGAAILDVVFRANAVRAWGQGAARLEERGSSKAGGLLGLEELNLNGEVFEDANKHVLDGVGALLALGKLARLNINSSRFGALETKRLSLEVATSRHLAVLKCA